MSSPLSFFPPPQAHKDGSSTNDVNRQLVQEGLSMTMVKKIGTTLETGGWALALLQPKKRKNKVEASTGCGTVLAVVPGRFLVVMSLEKQ